VSLLEFAKEKSGYSKTQIVKNPKHILLFEFNFIHFRMQRGKDISCMFGAEEVLDRMTSEGGLSIKYSTHHK